MKSAKYLLLVLFGFGAGFLVQFITTPTESTSKVVDQYNRAVQYAGPYILLYTEQYSTELTILAALRVCGVEIENAKAEKVIPSIEDFLAKHIAEKTLHEKIPEKDMVPLVLSTAQSLVAGYKLGFEKAMKQYDVAFAKDSTETCKLIRKGQKK